MPPAYPNSVDKIVFSYLAAVTVEPFTYNGRVIEPKPLFLSTGLVRGYTCPEGCGGCCMKFTLVWLPSEPALAHLDLDPFFIEVNGKAVLLYGDLQRDNTQSRCRHLRLSDARCGIHGYHPFSCDFELIRIHSYEDRNRMNTQLFGRGWNMLRVDGERGAKCTITPPTDETIADTARKLRRLGEWAAHFGIRTCLDKVIHWVETGPHQDPLILSPRQRGALEIADGARIEGAGKVK